MANRPTTFVDFVESLSPSWLLGEFSAGWAGVLWGLTGDILAEGLSVALRAGLLADPDNPDDALPLFAEERRLPRYPLETAAAHRARLRNAWEAYRFGGSMPGMLKQLELAGYPGAEIEFRPLAEGPKGEPAPYWSQFWIVWPIGTHPVTGPGPEWGSFDWGDGTLWGPEGITQEYIATIKGIIRKWKPSRWICRGIVFTLSEPVWGGFDWGDGTVWGGRVEIEV